ncbi:MAG: hypothetical protein KAX20_01755 [Candidatus Omnitrophica bacterium]|nr:hypothetical protein [Candidatus Omnitrophota bacterium]
MKKKYCKPEIKSVELKPEEAVLTACKANSSGGDAAGNVGGSCKYRGNPCGEQYGS